MGITDAIAPLAKAEGFSCVIYYETNISGKYRCFDLYCIDYVNYGITCN